MQTGQEESASKASEPGNRREFSSIHNLAWLPIPIFIIAIVALAIWHIDGIWNPPLLIPSLNIIFGITCTFIVFALATKSYLARRSMTVLFLGCAMLAGGLGVTAGALYITIRHNIDMNMAIISSMMFLSGLCDMGAALGGISLAPRRLRSGWQYLLASYLAIIVIFAVLVLLIQFRLIPAQYVNGLGTTPIGMLTYGMAVGLIAFAGILLMLKRTGDETPFRRWYGMGLVLVATGLTGVALQTALGDPLNWVGRISEYVGSVYILVAVISTVWQSGEWLLPIERALHESEEKFRVLAETSSAMFAIYQGEKFVYVNSAAETLTGYPNTELLAMRFWDIMHPEFRELVRERGTARQRGEREPSKYDIMLLTKNGESKWAELTSGRIEYCGKPANIATIYDITNRKLAEQAIQEKQEELEVQAEELEAQNEELESQNEEIRANNEELVSVTRSLQDTEGRLRIANERFDTVLNRLTDSFAICDSNWRYLYVNETYARLLGKSREQLLGLRVWDLIPQAVGTLNYENCMKSAEDRMPRTWTSSITFTDRVLEYRTFAWDEGLAILTRDITKEKRTETALLDSERRYRSLFESMQEGFYLAKIVFDDNKKPCDFVYLDVNPAFERIMGKSREQIIGQLATEVVPDLAAHWINAFSEVALTGTPLQYSSYSEVFKKYFETLVYRPAEGQFAVLVMDITQRKLAEKELVNAKMQAELYLDLMGHDISNMHQIALGQLELAKDIINTDGKLEAADGGTIDTSIESLWRSARLIDNVRKLQKIRSEEVKNKEIDLDDLLTDTIKQYDGQYPEKVIKIDSSEGSHIVKANELLRDVFTNLIGNAIKHSNGSKVDILVKLEEVRDNGKNYYGVSIEDDGPGVPDDMKDKIFNRLQQGETKARGMGLGLYLVRSLVESYNGKVWVEDRVPGDHTKGSRFVVTLPAIEN